MTLPNPSAPPGAGRGRPPAPAVTKRRRGASRATSAVLMVAAVVVCAAPVAGDIGSCNQALEPLDAYKFFSEKQRVDCEQCARCGFATETCSAACDGASLPESFAPGCYPLAHDGEVCLRALRDADCDEYAPYVADQAAETPTECAFCPPDQRPEGP